MSIRAALLALLLVALVPLALYAPYVGIYAYYWYSFGGPISQAYGFAAFFDWGKLLAVAVLLSWLLGRSSKMLPFTSVTVLVILFYLWTGITTLTARFPVPATEHFFLWSKIFLMFVVTLAVINSRLRLHGMIWTLSIAIGYYGLKGGAFTLVAGGNYSVMGPEGTAIYATNEFARAIMMTIPMIFYLSIHSAHKFIRLGMYALTPVCILAMVGTNSRSTLLAFGGMCVVLWLYSRHKVVYLALGTFLVGAGWLLLPEARIEGMTERYSTIETYETDDSLNTRFEIWGCILDLTANSPVVGGGFMLSEYACSRASHSNYFEVLGEHGYVGLLIYIMLGICALAMSLRLTVLGRRAPEFYWARDLGVMMQCVLVGYLIGGVTKNHAFFELYYVQLAILVAAYTIVRRDIKAQVDADRRASMIANNPTLAAAARARVPS